MHTIIINMTVELDIEGGTVSAAKEVASFKMAEIKATTLLICAPYTANVQVTQYALKG